MLGLQLFTGAAEERKRFRGPWRKPNLCMQGARKICSHNQWHDQGQDKLRAVRGALKICQSRILLSPFGFTFDPLHLSMFRTW